MERLGALSYIEWDQITGVGGPGTVMEFMCQGGYGVIYKGRWQVRGFTGRLKQAQQMCWVHILRAVLSLLNKRWWVAAG